MSTRLMDCTTNPGWNQEFLFGGLNCDTNILVIIILRIPKVAN